MIAGDLTGGEMITGKGGPESTWRRVGGARVPAAVLSVLVEPDGGVVVGGAGGAARQSPNQLFGDPGQFFGHAGWDAFDPGVGAVAALARSGSTLLAAGADGIAWSADAGRSWRRAAVQGTVAPVTALVAAGGDILAATLGGGVLRSADEGRRWVPSGFGLASHDVTALAIVADQTVVAGTDAGIHVSPNGGRAWRQVADTVGVRIAAIAVSLAGTAWAAAQAGDILMSTDGGRTWVTRGALPTGAEPSSLLVDGANPQVNRVLVATSAGILASIDDGDAWHAVDDEPGLVLARGEGIVVAGTGVGVLESRDGGSTWVSRGEAPPVHDLARLVVVDGEPFAYGPMAGVVRCTSAVNSGGEPVDGAPYPVAVMTAGPAGTVLASGPEGLARSVDQGATWTTVISGDAGFLHVLSAGVAGSWWAASGDGSRLLRSGDDGRSWIPDRAPWGTAGVLALGVRGDGVLAATYDTSGAAVDLWRRPADGAWAHAGRVPTRRPSVALCLQPPAAVFDGRWMYGDPGGGWRQGDGPDGRLRRLTGADTRLVALTDQMLAESTDRGRTWTSIAGLDAPDVLDVAVTATTTYALLRSGELWTRN